MAESRVEMLDGAEKVTSRVETSLDWIGEIRAGVTRHPVIWIGGSVVSGLLVIKLLSGLFGGFRRRHEEVASSSPRHSTVAGALSSVAKLLVMAALPSLKTVVQEFCKTRLSSWLGRY